MYSLTFNFETLKELESYVEKIIKLEVKEKKRLTKKESLSNMDKRGSMTKILHKEAKLIHKDDSTKTYKECLKLAGLKLKQNKTNLKEN
jgi:uncharacterized protein (UPF0335 family)